MHDLDRTQTEFAPALETGFGELSEEFLSESGEIFGGVLQESPIAEVEQNELAAGLLEVTNEDELDQFLGDVLKKVAKSAGKVLSSPVGNSLKGILRNVAKKALPIAGGALGTFFGGPAGGAIGSKLASFAGNAFGLEVEGLSPQDRDFEIARQYVKLASSAAHNALVAPPTAAPQQIARRAVEQAAARFAPGLLTGGAATPSSNGALPKPRSGRWVRQGRQIVLYGI